MNEDGTKQDRRIQRGPKCWSCGNEIKGRAKFIMAHDEYENKVRVPICDHCAHGN